MPKLNQKGIAPLILIILVVLGLILGVWLVQNRTNILPSAQENNANLAPQTAFHLLLSRNYHITNGRQGLIPEKPGNGPDSILPYRTWFYPGEEIQVSVAVSSDIEEANTFLANISYPADLLEVTEIIRENVTSVSDSVQGNDSGYAKPVIKISPEPKICAQIITRACKTDKVRCAKAPCPEQRVCQEFPTPCDIPEGWTVENGSEPISSQIPTPSCRPRPACLDASPACKMPETSDMCPPSPGLPKLTLDYFIQLWLPDTGFNNEKGEIILSGGVLNGGIKTTPPNKPIMATIVFKSKKAGEVKLELTEKSLILANSGGSNILTAKNGITFEIKDQNIPVRVGDLDGDGVVGLKDFSILLSKFGTDNENADLNADSKVDIFDFSLLISNWNR